MQLPFKLPGSLGTSAGVSGLFFRTGVAYHYAIGGLPWLSAASLENPIMRETAAIRKDQVDQQLLPGEQSLESWWLRSQQSFHGGAGQVFADPTQDNPFNSIRFRSSRNIHPWEQGEVRLLNEAVGTAEAGVVDATEFNYVDGDPATFAVSGTTFYVIRDGTIDSAAFTESAQPLQSVTTDGSSIFVATLDGVYSAPIPDDYDADLSTEWVWTEEYEITGNTAPCFMAWVKSRIMLTVGPAIYELVPAHPDSPPDPLPTDIFTHRDPNWVWTSISETASAILLVGNSRGVRGSVLKLLLDEDGAIPTLSAATIAAQLPSGEVPFSVIGYLGRFVGFGTNKGVRIGVADSAGDVEYGPLLFPTSSPVRAWSARDRFLWCTVSRGIDGDSGLYRIDLGLELANLRFPYATDLVADNDTSNCVAVAHIGSSDKLFFATANNIYTESDNRAPNGYLQTSRIRYNTVEPKLYKFVRVRGPVLAAPLAVITIDQSDSTAGTHLFSTGVEPGETEVTLFSPANPIDFMSLRFVFTRDSENAEVGPTMWAYQLKALPGSRRQRIIQLPLLCFDWESDRNGQRRGGDGTAQQRLRQLEEVEAVGNTISLQDFDMGEVTECVIEHVRFQQTAPPPKFGGWGGIVTVALRTVR